MLRLFESIIDNIEKLVNQGYYPLTNFKKYPLKDSWSLWLFMPEQKRQWRKNQHLVSTFNTIDDCWGLFSAIKSPSESRNGITYSLFRECILPMWEDVSNRKGGRWELTLSRNWMNHVDFCWTKLVLSLVSESFTRYGPVCGAVITIRQNNIKMSLWVSGNCTSYEIMEIGRVFKRNLQLGKKFKIQFKQHDDCVDHGASNAQIFMEI
ncbi:hypothetical protein PVAND_012788 [Polypedilum vanderplanki]|uniref:EIF-4F 25 kDa subunit n=1 Tax=Polypedilum vanderplanki TaxID=319348 RepID=A0A9J6CMJ7_POLVA|nr:hypothetical protein PVAND_012788 [Polypedilum vanderplanki]